MNTLAVLCWLLSASPQPDEVLPHPRLHFSGSVHAALLLSYGPLPAGGLGASGGVQLFDALAVAAFARFSVAPGGVIPGGGLLVEVTPIRWLSLDAGFGALAFIGTGSAYATLIIPAGVFLNIDGPAPHSRRPAWRLGFEVSSVFLPRADDGFFFGGLLLTLSAGVVFH